jgi:hypothetical protein
MGRKRYISNDTSQTAKKSTISVPKSAPVKLPTKAIITHNFFSPLKTNNMDTETPGAENALPEQEAPRKSGRPQTIVMTSTTNLIPLESDLKNTSEESSSSEKQKWNSYHKKMADYSAMKSYLEKNNLQYFIFSPNSEKPIKAIIHHLPPDTPAEDISNSLENLSLKVINVRQLTTNRRAPTGQTHMETLPLFLVTLTRNEKCQEIFKLNSLNHIIIKVESYKAKTGLTQCYNCQNVGRVWPNCRQPPRCSCYGGSHLRGGAPKKRI